MQLAVGVLEGTGQILHQCEFSIWTSVGGGLLPGCHMPVGQDAPGGGVLPLSYIDDFTGVA